MEPFDTPMAVRDDEEDEPELDNDGIGDVLNNLRDQQCQTAELMAQQNEMVEFNGTMKHKTLQN